MISNIFQTVKEKKQVPIFSQTIKSNMNTFDYKDQ